MSRQTGTIIDKTFHSEALQEEVPLLIYLPPAFSPLYKYSLLIAADGKDYFQMGRIGRVADRLLEEDKIENIIIVGVPYRNSEDRWDKYDPDGEKFEAYKRFLARELLPYLEEEYPTYHMGMSRALIGDSLGATVSLMTALDYPHTFGKAALHSPLVNERVMEAVEQFSYPHLMHIYHVIGNKETAVETTRQDVIDFLTPNRELNLLMESQGFPSFFEEIDGGEHTWKSWQADMERTLLWLFGK